MFVGRYLRSFFIFVGLEFTLSRWSNQDSEEINKEKNFKYCLVIQTTIIIIYIKIKKYIYNCLFCFLIYIFIQP